MTRRSISIPSHYTQRQTRRILARQAPPILVSDGGVWALCQKGRPLEAETHDGTRMIPMWRIMAFIDKRKKEAQ